MAQTQNPPARRSPPDASRADGARSLESRFLGKDEVIRLLLIAVVAGEHAVLVGPPGTAKSALIRMFARLLQANYFEYLLTRFTEPNELFGPVDIAAFREGRYQRRTEGMLPELGDRLPRRDLQVEQRDPQLAAHAPQRAPLHVGRRRDEVPAALVLRRLERGARPTRRSPRSSTASCCAFGRTISTPTTSTTSSRRASSTRSARSPTRRCSRSHRRARSRSCIAPSRSACSSPRSSSASTRAWSSRSAPRASASPTVAS